MGVVSMIGKRFTMEKSMVDGGYYIYDNRTDFQYPTTPYGLCEIFWQKLDELSDENEELKKFKKQAYLIINNKINELAMTTSYGDVHNDLRVFAQRVLIDVKKEFDNPTYENCKVMWND